MSLSMEVEGLVQRRRAAENGNQLFINQSNHY